MTAKLSRRGFMVAMGAVAVPGQAPAAEPDEYDVTATLVLGGAKPRISSGSILPLAGAAATLTPVTVPRRRNAPLQGLVVRRQADAPLLLFCPGNGYAGETALRAFLKVPALSSMSIAVADYWSEGAAAPSIAATRSAMLRFLQAARGQASHVVVVGHSLGCWFAADLGARGGVDQVILVAPGTTVEAVVRRLFDVTPGRTIRIDPDVLGLNLPRQASRIRAGTAILASEGDEMMPVVFARTIYAALPHARRKGLLVLPDVGHGEFFSDPRTWTFIESIIDKEVR